MRYIYIFDYTFGNIYEVAIEKKELPKINTKYVELYLYKHYNLKAEEIDYMISDRKLEIEQINKVK